MACVFALPTTANEALYIVLGQAHFALTYLYQWRAGKMKRAYAWRWWLVFVLVFGAYALYPQKQVLMMGVMAWFLLHFVLDEIHLLSGRVNGRRLLPALPLLLLSTGLLLDLGVTNHLASQLLGPSLWVYGLVLMLVLRDSGRRPSDLWLLAMTLLPFSAVAFGWLHFQENYMAFIILLHVFHWYAGMQRRFETGSARMRRYWVDVFWVNALLASGWFVYAAGALPSLFVFYRDDYYYLWVILHYLVTFRPTDFAFLGLRLRPAQSAC